MGIPAKLTISPILATAELCRRHLRDFVPEFWEEIIAEPLVWSPHMEIICDEVEIVYRRLFMRYYDKQNPAGYLPTYQDLLNEVDLGDPIGRLPKLYDLIVNVPPGTSKSTLISQMAIAWGWANDPTLRHITGSYKEDTAIESSEKCRDIVLSERFKLYYPYVKLKADKSGVTNYKTTKGGQRLTTSTGAGVTGIHAHLRTIDDPLSTQGALSAADLKTVKHWMENTLPTRTVDKRIAAQILVMQRLATNDPTGNLLELQKKGIPVRWICLPATLEKGRDSGVRPKELEAIYVDGYLDPVRMTEKELSPLRLILGPSEFAGQFQQRPSPAGGLIWKASYFIPVPDEYFPSREALKADGYYGTDWDTAYTKDEENAATAYMTAGSINGRMYIDDIGWFWCEYPEMIEEMKRHPAPHFIEAKASGKSSKQTLFKAGIVATEVQIPGGGDKIARAKLATPPGAAGMVMIRASLYDRLLFDDNQGITYFPKGTNADMADVTAQSISRVTHGGEWIAAAGTTTGPDTPSMEMDQPTGMLDDDLDDDDY